MKLNTKKINKVPVVTAGSTLNNKTGPWRTYKPVTDLKKCIGCSLCSKVCPDACIVMIQKNKKNIPVTNYDYCKGCGLCAHECPVKAINMEKDY